MRTEMSDAPTYTVSGEMRKQLTVFLNSVEIIEGQDNLTCNFQTRDVRLDILLNRNRIRSRA